MPDKALEEELKQLRADLATLRGDVSDLVEAVGDEGARQFDAARDSAAEGLRRRRDALRRQIDASAVRGREAIEDLGETAQEHPLGSLALAFGMGFIVSKLIDLGGRH